MNLLILVQSELVKVPIVFFFAINVCFFQEQFRDLTYKR